MYIEWENPFGFLIEKRLRQKEILDLEVFQFGFKKLINMNTDQN